MTQISFFLSGGSCRKGLNTRRLKQADSVTTGTLLYTRSAHAGMIRVSRWLWRPPRWWLCVECVASTAEKGGPLIGECRYCGKHPQNAAMERYVPKSGILPLYRVDAVPSDFDAAKPDVPLFRAPLYRATYRIFEIYRSVLLSIQWSKGTFRTETPTISRVRIYSIYVVGVDVVRVRVCFVVICSS